MTPRHGVAIRATRLPLSPHCNPFSVSRNSLGDFHRSLSVSLASFAEKVSESRGPLIAPAGAKTAWPLIRQSHARQATSAHSAWGPKPVRTALQVHNLLRTQLGNTTAGVRLCTRTGLHGNRVGVTMPLEIALSPQARSIPRFPPAPTQNWAYQAGTRGFIDVPFRGFLGPPSETAVLTRILRRRLARFSITQSS